jgi:predicted metalloprotease with PDZ domain
MLNKQTLVFVSALILALLTVSAQAQPQPLHNLHDAYVPFAGIIDWTLVSRARTYQSPVIEGEGPAGVGMEINQDRAGHFIVQRLEPQGPAERSKISIGDRILRVNGTQIDGLHINEVVSLCVEILEQK